MASNRQPPPYSKRLTVALFGKRAQLKNSIGKMILHNRPDAFDVTSNSFDTESNKSFKVINTPDFFDDRCLYPDQLIIDFMALSHPGPDLFILATDSENTQEEKVVTQIIKLQGIFGDNITANLVVTLPDLECFHSLRLLKNRFNTQLAVASENLASECRKWCAERHSFHFNYVNYSEDVVRRRMAAIEDISGKSLSYDGHAVCHCGTAGAEAMSPTISYVFAAPANEEAPQHGRLNIRHISESRPAKSTIALFGKKVPLKNSIGKMILTNRPNAFATTSNSFVIETNDSFKIINVPDFFDEECQHPDQMIIDFMALSHPGPDLFILAIDSENTKEDKVVAQIKNLKATFGDNITANLVIMLPDAKSLNSLRQLEQKFNTQLAVASENLASECKKWCSDRKSFQYNYENYSEDVVLRRMTALENISSCQYRSLTYAALKWQKNQLLQVPNLLSLQPYSIL
ncbi:hypothetical protein ABVT39_007497 [Epinephelus coioides]